MGKRARRLVVFVVLAMTVSALASCGPAVTGTRTAAPVPAATLPLLPPATARPTVTPITPFIAPPRPTSAPSPTHVPWPTLVPTVDPALLPELLRTSFSMQEVPGLEGHLLRRVAGWNYGLRSADYCEGPYRWLDSHHLLLYPNVGEEEGMQVTEYTWPVVVSLDSGASWPVPMDERAGYCELPPWSAALQRLLATRDSEVLLFDASGRVTERFAGRGPLRLSPSGRRLVAGSSWLDLETGRTVELPADVAQVLGDDVYRPAWSADESRLFSCCFAYADVNRGPSEIVDLAGLDPLATDVPIGFFIQSRWVQDESRVLIDWEFDALRQSGVVPLIDPVTATYSDVRVLAGIPLDLDCWDVEVASEGDYAIVGCWGGNSGDYWYSWYLVNLRTFSSQPLGDLAFESWSPDGQFALLGRDVDWPTRCGEHAVLSLCEGNLRPVAGTTACAPVWNPQGNSLALLQDGRRTLLDLRVDTWATRQVSLTQPASVVLWRPQGDGLALLSDDGRLWWLPDLATSSMEALTPPLPAVHNVHWSPDGRYLAFVAGADAYVVSVQETGP